MVAEHDNSSLSPASLSAVTAAGELKGDVTLLVIGHQAEPVAEQVMCPSSIGPFAASKFGVEWRVNWSWIAHPLT